MSRQNNCNEEQLVLYHYDELTLPERQKVETHLQGCPDCRAELNDLQAALAIVPQMKLEFSEAEKLRFAEQVTDRVRRSPRHLRAAWGGVFATAALVAGVMFFSPADLPQSVVPSEPAVAEFEMLEQLDLLQELDLLKELDLLQEMGQLG